MQVFATPLPLAWKWFPGRKGVVSGFILGGFGAGSTLFNMISSKYANPLRLPPVEGTGEFPAEVHEPSLPARGRRADADVAHHPASFSLQSNTLQPTPPPTVAPTR